MSSTKIQSSLAGCALVGVAGSLTYLITRDGIGVSEDPVFQNGSYLITNFFSEVGPNQRGTLAEGLRALAFPYGFLSYVLQVFNVEQPSDHYKIQLFAHILFSSTFTYLAISRFASRQIAIALSLIAISTQAYYEQFLYSIGSAQLAIAWITIRLVYPQPARLSSKVILLITLAASMGVPLWSNLPQLTATALFACVVFFVALLTNRRRIQVFQLCLLLVLITTLIYVPFAIFSLQELEAFRNYGTLVGQSEFRNASARYVLQGAGKWSLLDNSWKVPRYIYDENLIRQLLRLSFPLIVITWLLIRRRKFSPIGVLNYLLMTTLFVAVCGSSGYDFRILGLGLLIFSLFYFYSGRRFAGAGTDRNDQDSTRMIEGLVALTLLVFTTSLAGWFESYWTIRRTTPLLTAFREPWAKFSQLYVLMLMCCVAALLSSIRSFSLIAGHRFVRQVLGISLAGVAIYCASVFLYFSPSYHTTLKHEFKAPSAAEWKKLDGLLRDALPHLNGGSLCIINQDPRLLGISIIRSVLPTDLNLAENCSSSSGSVKVLFLNYSKSLGISTGIQSLNPECLLFTTPEMIVISSHCVVRSNWPSSYSVSLIESALSIY